MLEVQGRFDMEQEFFGGKYKVSDSTFEYLGHVEPLSKIAALEVLESDVKKKIIAGLTLSFWGLLFSFFPGFILTIFIPNFFPSVEDPQLVSSVFFMSLFFILGFFLRAQYRLVITKVSGNKGSIGNSRKSRTEFDQLIETLNDSMYRNL